MTRTPILPLDDRGMGRHLVGRAHPDAGGEDSLFILAMATRYAICGGDLGPESPRRRHRDDSSQRYERSTSGTAERVPFDQFADFEVLTDRAPAMAAVVAEPYGYLLRQVAGCYLASHEGALY